MIFLQWDLVLSFNKNILVALALSTVLNGCGVKGYPTAPAGSAIPAYENQFINPDTGPSSIKKNVKKKKSKSKSKTK